LLGDPQAEHGALQALLSRREGLEAEKRQTQRRLEERLKKQLDAEQVLASLAEAQAVAEAQRKRRDEAAADHQAYLSQQAVVDSMPGVEDELATKLAHQQTEEQALRALEGRVAELTRMVSELASVPADIGRLESETGQARLREEDLRKRLQRESDAAERLREQRERMHDRQHELARLGRAAELLRFAEATVARAEASLGERVRADLAEAAGAILRSLLAEPSIGLQWPWGEGLSLARDGATIPLDKLNALDQACTVVALRLALLHSVSDVRVVFVEGLGQILRRADIASRLEALPGLAQLFLTPTA
ncbi:MAG: hypothetical protein ACYDAG_10780, partial [Chloroflexota bacterium]